MGLVSVLLTANPDWSAGLTLVWPGKRTRTLRARPGFASSLRVQNFYWCYGCRLVPEGAACKKICWRRWEDDGMGRVFGRSTRMRVWVPLERAEQLTRH